MKTCKIKPHGSTCRDCMDIADSFNSIPDCNKCSYQTKRYDLIQIGSNFGVVMPLSVTVVLHIQEVILLL